MSWRQSLTPLAERSLWRRQRLAESKLVSTSANASLRRVFEPFVPGGHAHTDPKPVVHGVQNTEYAWVLFSNDQ